MLAKDCAKSGEQSFSTAFLYFKSSLSDTLLEDRIYRSYCSVNHD